MPEGAEFPSWKPSSVPGVLRPLRLLVGTCPAAGPGPAAGGPVAPGGPAAGPAAGPAGAGPAAGPDAPGDLCVTASGR